MLHGSAILLLPRHLSVALMAQLVWRHSCVADRLLVVDRIPAGPWVRLKLSGPCLRAETAVDSKKIYINCCFMYASSRSHKLSETIFAQTGIRDGTSPVRKTAVDTREDCRWKFSIAPGTYSMQNCPYRNKDVEQAKVVDLLYECGLVYITDFTRRVFGAE